MLRITQTYASQVSPTIMADSHNDRSSDTKQDSLPASDEKPGISTPSQNLNMGDDRSSQTSGQTTKLVCQNCGAHTVSIIQLQLVGAIRAPETANTVTDSHSNDPGKTKPEGSDKVMKDEEANALNSIRIGRFIRDKNGVDQLVDYTDSDRGEPDHPNAGNFVFAIRSEFNWHREDLERPEESIVLLSPPLAKAYRSVVKDFAGTRLGRLGRRSATIPEPFAPLFFYYDRIAEAARSPEFACEEDFAVLAQYYSERILPEHDRIRASLAEGMVQYDDLWAIFRLGDPIFSMDECGEPCLQILIRTDYRQSSRYYDDESKRKNRMVAETWHISWDHSTATFNRVIRARAIFPFSGIRPITSLPFYPINYYKGGSVNEIETLKTQLETRGHLWKKLMSQKSRCLKYTGPARKFSAREDEYVCHCLVMVFLLSTHQVYYPAWRPRHYRWIYEHDNSVTH